MSTATPVPAWRLLVDENPPRSLVADLIALGHTAAHVYDLGMGGTRRLRILAPRAVALARPTAGRGSDSA